MINIDIFKENLEKEKKILLEELSSIAKKDKSDGDWEAEPENEEIGKEVQDEADIAERSEDYEKRYSVTEELEKRLTDIEDALSEIENGNYGICEKCSKEIEEDRLKANPAAKTCKACMNS